MKKISLFGFHGRKNTGDDAMLYGIVKYLDHLGAFRLIIHSNTRCILPKISNLVVEYRKRSIFGLLRSAVFGDYLLLGGGSAFHTKNNLAKFNKMTLRTLGFVLLAKMFGTKVGFLSFGFGPFHNMLGTICFRLMMKYVDYANVRDFRSFEMLEDLGLSNHKFSKTGDFAFFLDLIPKKDTSHVIGVNILPFGTEYQKESDNSEIVKYFSDFAQRMIGDGFEVVFYAFNDNETENYSDTAVIQEIIERLSSEHVSIFPYNNNPEEYIKSIANNDLFITMRYHGIIYSYLSQVKCICISYMDKCTSLVQEMDVDQVQLLNMNDLYETDIYLESKNFIKSDVTYDLEYSENMRKALYNSIPKTFFSK